MTNKDVNQYYLANIARVADAHLFSIKKNVYNNDGDLVMLKGAKFNSESAARLNRHQLDNPLDFYLSSELLFDNDILWQDLYNVIEQYPELTGLTRHYLDPLKLLCREINKYPSLCFKLAVFSKRYPKLYEQALYVAVFSHLLASKIKRMQINMENLFLSALVQDIGFLAISEAHAEPHHCKQGQLLLGQIDHFPDNVKLAVAQHHERCDGSGYPTHLIEKHLILEGQIIAFTDECYWSLQQKLVPAGLSISNLKSMMQLNHSAHFYACFQALCELLELSPKNDDQFNQKINSDFILDMQKTLHQLQEGYLALLGLSKIFDSSQPEVMLIKYALRALTFSLDASGLLLPEHDRWLIKVNNKPENLNELKESYLLYMQVQWQLSDIVNLISRFLNKLELDSKKLQYVQTTLSQVDALNTQPLRKHILN